jgi:long-chain acyl-CoA synthetase
MGTWRRIRAMPREILPSVRRIRSVSYLPLSHITARALDYAMFFFGAQVAYCSQFENLIVALKQVRPTVFVGVPRVYEKIRQGVEQKSAASP